MLEEKTEANNGTVDTFSPQRSESENIINKVKNLTINDVGNDMIDKVADLKINDARRI